MKNYKNWPGNLKFYMDGKIICGSNKDQLSIIFTFTIVIWFMLTYILVVYPLAIANNIIIYPSILLFLSFLPLNELIKTTCTDPGVLLRSDLEESLEEINTQD